MCRRLCRIAVLTFIAAFGSIMPVLAQDEGVLIEFVASALENTRAVDSLAADMQQTTRQTVSSLGLLVIRTFEQAAKGEVVLLEADPRIAMTFEQNFIVEDLNIQGTPTVADSLARTIDIIALDGQIHARMRDAVPTVTTPVPNQWLDITASTDPIPGLEITALERYIDMMMAGLQYPLTTSVVTEIAEMDTDELDGQTMRVFDISLDWERLLLLNLDEFELLKQMMWDLTSEVEGTFNIRLWVGADDGLVHQVQVTAKTERELDRDPDNAYDTVNITETHRISFRYSQFNQPFEIEAPSSDT
jgi:hypothetical protein